jgi:LacI family transcriptional regulator
MSRRATVRDVAQLAGVSTASVSRALTGARPVSSDVAERVSKAADQLGYRIDPLGRSLRLQSTQTIGLVVADITNPFFPALVQAVEGAIRVAGLGLLLADAQNSPDLERSAVAMLLARRIDALLITPCHRLKSRTTVRDAVVQVPVVQLDRTATTQAHFVGVDHSAAIGDLLAHLGGRGRRHLAFVGSDTSVSSSWERQQAFARLATKWDPNAPHRVLVGNFSIEWGRAAAATIVDEWPEVDGVVCADDLIALGVIQELNRRGIDVPGTVAVTGFDNTSLAVVSVPSITSVDQSVTETARIAVELATRFRPAAGRHRIRVPAQLIARSSSGG